MLVSLDGNLSYTMTLGLELLLPLTSGANAGVAVNVRTVLDVTNRDLMTLHYIVVDKEGTLCALSVYGLEVGP